MDFGVGGAEFQRLFEFTDSFLKPPGKGEGGTEINVVLSFIHRSPLAQIKN
jgi:hypothetical protein